MTLLISSASLHNFTYPAYCSNLFHFYELTQLIDPDQMLSTSKTSPQNDIRSNLVGIVLPNEHGNKALSVREIIDVELGQGSLEKTMNQEGLLGTLLVGNTATEILDIPTAVRLLDRKRLS